MISLFVPFGMLFFLWRLGIIPHDKLVRALWYVIFFITIVYNFHRYIFKYSSGSYGKEGYEQTPFQWQVGKYVIIAVMLCLIYLSSDFVTRIPAKLLLFYSFLGVILVVNVGSILFFHQVVTDELEYIVFGLMVLPLGFVAKSNLQQVGEMIGPFLNLSQYILIASNWIVIFNYFAFGIVPFHAFAGVLLRFGGLWDDPNTLAIMSVLLMGYAMMHKQYVLVGIHVVNVILTLSLNGFFLLVVFAAYWSLNNPKKRVLSITVFAVLIALVAFLVFTNLDYVFQLYDAKKESIDQHANLSFVTFYWVPLLQPVLFLESWLVGINVNYFPFSVPFTLLLLIIFMRFFFFQPRSLQRLFFILFFVTNLFLPLLYMFPVNFIAFLFLVLYTKGIRF